MAGMTKAQLSGQLELVTESLAELESLMREDRGWRRLDMQATQSFTREGLNRQAALCRTMVVANPLIKRGGLIRAGYVWGQGVGITAKDETVNDVVQDFLDDDEVRAILTGHQAHIESEGQLYTDGNWICALFTEPVTGRVHPRILDFESVTERITDPEDKSVTWFYKYEYHQSTTDTAGKTTTVRMVRYHPDVHYRPALRDRYYAGKEIRWDAPIVHVKVNPVKRSDDWGVGDAYTAINWARGYSDFLNDWARLTKALSKIAWSLSSPTKSKAQSARANVQGMNNPDGPAGGTALMANMKLEAVPKTGATLDSESGRPLAAMVAAGIGVPVTTLMADPGQTGARAVAETLDTPTEMEMSGRRELWTEANRTILNYVIDSAALAPQNGYGLRGRLVQDGTRRRVELLGDLDRTLVFDWPDLTGDDLATVIEAIVKVADTDKVPGVALAKLIELVFRALKVRDVDELMAEITDENGALIDPATTAGDAAVDAFNRGEDPAGALR